MDIDEEIKAFRNRMNGMLSADRQAEALIEIAIEMKMLRNSVGECENFLNEIANKTR